MIEIQIEQNVKKLGIYLAYSVVTGIDNMREVSELYNVLIPKLINYVKSKLNLDKLKDEVNIRIFRDLYWRLGIDPTKQRPAHEALIRRVLRGEDFPKVNPAVDIGNYASIKYMLPVGLYDLDKVASTCLVLRFAKQGEKVRLLGSGEKTLSERQIVLATCEGKILHVFPHRDSEETSISRSSRNILVVVAGLDPIPREQALACIQEINQLLKKLLGGEIALEPRII